MYFIRTVPWLKLNDSLLVVPAVAPGNVGELAVDALIAGLDLERVGYLDDHNVLPCAGNDAYNLKSPGTLTTNLELFGKAGSPIYVLQQRAPVIVGRQQNFAANVAAWVKEAGFRSTLVLCGLSSQYRRDKQMEGPQIRFVAKDPDAMKILESLEVLPLEDELLQEEHHAHSLLPPWVFLSKCEEEGLSTVMLGVFAAEGDNIPDAMLLMQSVLPYLLQQPGLSDISANLHARPVSWLSVYGRSFEKSLYTL